MERFDYGSATFSSTISEARDAQNDAKSSFGLPLDSSGS
jgi:hypothetical protein